MRNIKKFLLLGGLFSITFGGKGGFSYDEGIIKLVWKRYVGSTNWDITNHPLIFGDKILHASRGDKAYEKDLYDKLYVFDKDGNLLWNFSSPDGGNTDLNGVVACNDYILVTSDQGYVYSLSWNGNIRWKIKVGCCPWAMSLYDLNGDGVPDALVGTRGDYSLHLLDGKTGREIWKFKTGDWIDSSPAIGDIDGDGKPEVVFGSYDHNVYAINGEDGSLLWKFKTGDWIDSSPAIGDIDGDGKPEVVFGSYDHNVYAINGEDGSLLWKFKTGESILSSPALGDVDGDGKLEIIFGSKDYNVYAINGEDGSLLWKFETKWYVENSPAIGDIDGDGKPEVVFGSDDHNVYTLNGEDGSLLWKFKTGNAVASSPALGDVDDDGKIDIVVASWDGYLYKFESFVQGGKIIWSRWHKDAYGTGNYEGLGSRQVFITLEPQFLISSGKNYFLPKDQILIAENNGKIQYPIEYSGIYIQQLKNYKHLSTSTPTGLILNLNPPQVEFKLLWKLRNGTKVKKIFLNNKSLSFIQYETKQGKYVETQPIVGNIFTLNKFTLGVFYTNGQYTAYMCTINKKLQLTCTLIPKLNLLY